jgi:choloylglycine hydrolase
MLVRMRRWAVSIPCVLLMALCLAPSRVAACTTFCLRHGPGVILAKNYDWHLGMGYVVRNARGVAKQADAGEEAAPARWVSRFGSLTFNQYGREFPSGGMNEAGLAVELMWLDGTRYPEPDARPALGCLQWIQYQLDTAGTVAELLASDSRVRIEARAPLHFLVADRSGDVATVEFLDGRLKVHRGPELPVAALTNNMYSTSVEYLGRADAGSGSAEGPGSLERFVRTARRVREFAAQPTADPVAFAFATLERAAQPRSTQWSIVYELDRGRVHFRTRIDGTIRTLAFADFDFDCRRPVTAIDLESSVRSGSATAPRTLLPEENESLVRRAFAGTPGLVATGDAEVRRVSSYPETTTCKK